MQFFVVPELGGHFELESGAHFKLELGGQYHWNLQTGIENKNTNILDIANVNHYKTGNQIKALLKDFFKCFVMIINIIY
ncbi:hypothetical protein ACM55F_15845 [Flavobacterium sp. XS2P12]|uniref:hypothetical protein n=1 Tax=Flavobacterium melibiosi TaxID=3398734 RepID=UPI003A84A0A6